MPANVHLVAGYIAALIDVLRFQGELAEEI
jgi:hypothetical protein